MRKLGFWLHNRSHFEMTLIGLLTTSAIGLAQHRSPNWLSYTAIFMLATGTVAWFGGRLPALVTAISSALLIFSEEWMNAHGHPGEWAAWTNALTHLASFAGTAFVTAAWRQTQLELEQRVRDRTAALAETARELEQNTTQLRDALELNRNIIASTSVGIVVARPTGEFLLVNAAVSHLVGDSAEIALKRNFQQLDSWRQSGLLALAEAVLASGVAQREEVRMDTSLGRAVWLDCHLTRFVSGGEPHLLGIAVDISQRKRGEHLLHLQRELAVTLSHTNELPAGLDSLLAAATTLPGLDCGGVYLVQEPTGDLALAAHRGLSAEFVAKTAYYTGQSPQATTIQSQIALYVTPQEVPPPTDTDCAREGLQALAVIPLRDRGHVIAVFNVASHTQAQIPADTRLALESIAAQAEGAIVRIRAEEACRQSEARLQTIIQNAPIVLCAVDRQEVVTFLDGRDLRFSKQAPPAIAGQRLAQTELVRRYPVILAQARRALAGEKFTEVVETGAVVFDCPYSPFLDGEGAVAGFIGVITDVTERVRLQRQLLRIVEHEQARFGQELHDGLCQQLVGLGFDIHLLEQSLRETAQPLAAQARRIAVSLDDALTAGRALARNLFPVKLEDEGLASALQELAAGLTLRHGLTCRFENPDDVLVPDNARAMHLYRIAQEALNNAVRHAQAREIVLRLTGTAAELHLTVSDDGVGLPANPKGGAGLGLHTMEYRARSLRGTLRVNRRPHPA